MKTCKKGIIKELAVAMAFLYEYLRLSKRRLYANVNANTMQIANHGASYTNCWARGDVKNIVAL